MDSEIRNELFTLLREVNDAGTMKDSQLRDCIDELEEIIARAAPEPTADAVIFTCTNPECDACEAERDPFPDMTADAVERAAKAIFREVVDSDWEAVGKRVKDTYRRMARAALEAADCIENDSGV